MAAAGLGADASSIILVCEDAFSLSNCCILGPTFLRRKEAFSLLSARRYLKRIRRIKPPAAASEALLSSCLQSILQQPVGPVLTASSAHKLLSQTCTLEVMICFKSNNISLKNYVFVP